MSLNNKGSINNTSGVSQHSHYISSLQDTATDSTNDGDTLISIGGTWVSQNALPYAVICGKTTVTLNNSTYNATTQPWSNGSATVDITATPYGDGTNSIFSLTPVVLCSAGPTTTQAALVVQANASTTSITFRLNYYGSATSTITISFMAIQMTDSDTKGMITKDPSLG
jgi:hypothetical protein